tara:strand:- start:939 stop:2573 length:1635 start_codon:yes stop_codon:yes gene_type:complete
MSKHFYEKSRFSEFKSNTTYHQLLEMTDDEFVQWARLLRKEVTEQWDDRGTPPVIGKNEKGIIKSFKKLKSNPAKYWKKDTSGDEESLGVIQNFNKDASVVNQFFPTMLKTKISVGKSADNGLSIYDHFSDTSMEDKFVNIMKRAVKRDSMYSWSRSLVDKKDENPFWNGQDGVQFIKDVHDGKVFKGKYSDLGIVLARVKESTLKNYGTFNEQYVGFGNLYLNSEEVNGLLATGYLNSTQTSNLGEIVDSTTSEAGTVTKYKYLIRWYDKTVGIFPKILQVFRLSCGQPAVNFPALTAKWIYENYTNHIDTDEPLHIYDSSSGWGGRIIGAMSSRKKVHYVGTDPNPDNFLDELGISRYEYVAKFYNDNCVDDFSDKLTSFFNVEKQGNTYELFQDGSEVISNNPKFQKYKGKLDIAFTSPPYFNREQYSQDENQSFKAYGEYEDWRDNFLKPTLTTIYEYLKNDRYILWNIADIKIGKSIYYPLEQDSIDILNELGCEYKGKLKMLMTRMVGLDPSKSGIKNSVKHDGKVYKFEPIFVFYKP